MEDRSAWPGLLEGVRRAREATLNGWDDRVLLAGAAFAIEQELKRPDASGEWRRQLEEAVTLLRAAETQTDEARLWLIRTAEETLRHGAA